jgi:hypothetical protein
VDSPFTSSEQALERMGMTISEFTIAVEQFADSWHDLLDMWHREDGEPGNDAMSPDTSEPYPF